MWVLNPLTITADQVTASNIAEDDAPVWTPGTYAKEALAIHDHGLFESLVADNTAEPGTDELSWFRRSSTNKFKPFDRKNSSPAQNAESITYTIKPGVRIDTLALIDTDATEATISITVPGQGVVFTETRQAIRSENRATFHGWFFAERKYRRSLVFLDIPTYADVANATIDVTVSKPSGTAGLGEILMGRIWKVGITLYETAPRLVSFSVDQRDAWGNLILTKRRATRNVSYRFAIAPGEIEYLLDEFANLTATELLFMGGNDIETFGTTLFGTFKDLTTPIEGPNATQAQIEVEGFMG